MYVYKTFPQRVRGLRIEKKMTQEQLANRIGVGKTSISNYENGYAVPTLFHLRKMAQIFNVSIAFLIGETDLRERYSELPDGIRIPVFYHMDLDAISNGTESSAESIIELPKSHQMRDDGFFAIQMWDDSMAIDHIFKNDYVVLRRTKEIDNGRIYLVIVGGLPYLRRVTRKDSMLFLNPNNEMSKKYEPLQISKEQAEVVGCVFQLITTVFQKPLS